MFIALLIPASSYAEVDNAIYLKPVQLEQPDEGHVFFGSYPQTEIVAEAEQCGTFGKVWAKNSDYIIDSQLYEQLSYAEWDINNDIFINGDKYHRLKKADAIRTSDANNAMYSWQDDNTYHYFKYEPLKWRIIRINNNVGLLFCDTAIDYQLYYPANSVVGYGTFYWSRSLLRRWLNDTFYNTAFNRAEQSELIPNSYTESMNNNKINNVYDNVYLLDYYNVTHGGFSADFSKSDPAKLVASSTYAKARGVASNYSKYAGYTTWMVLHNKTKTSTSNPDDGFYIVNSDGTINENFCTARDYNSHSICPVILIGLKTTDPIVLGRKKYTEMSLSADEFLYDGTEKKPTVTIEGLVEGTDYKLSYANCIEAGTASVTATGIGDFEGNITKTYSIIKKDIGKFSLALSESTFTYSGTEQCPSASINGLTEGIDYELSYSNNVNVGTASVTATGIGEYTGTITKSFTIKQKSFTPEEYTVSLSQDRFYYDKTEKCPEVTIEGLDPDTDYDVTYSNNINVGTGTAIITGKGNYTGTLSVSFLIEKQDVIDFNITLSQDRFEYDGEEKRPEVIVEGLEEGVDYTLTYANNINGGKASVTITGIDKYKGTVVKNFVIWKEYYSLFVDGEEELHNEGDLVEISSYTDDVYMTFSEWTIESGNLDLSSSELQTNPLSFSMPASDVSITSVYTGKTLQDELDDENRRHQAVLSIVSTSADRAAENALHEENIANICAKHYVINTTIDEIKTVSLDKYTYDYTGNPIKPTVTIITNKGNKLGTGSYDVVYPDDCTSGGTHSLEIVFKRNYVGSITKDFTIVKHNYGDWTITNAPTCHEDGAKERTCLDCGKIEVATVPASHTFGDWAISSEATCSREGRLVRVCTFCNERETKTIPKLEHKWKNSYSVDKSATTSVPGSKSIHCSVCNTVKPGSIVAIPKLAAPVQTPKEIIDLQVVKISKPKAAKKAVNVKWKKVSKKNKNKIQGIEIQYSLNGFQTIAGTKYAKKTKSSIKIKGLQAKKKYWIRIRAYKNAADGKHVSVWKTKTVKTK